MKPARLLERLLTGRLANVAFADLHLLVRALGFELLRVSGSHRIYSHPDVLELLCLQPHRGEAKPYQIRQLLAVIQRYNLKLRGLE
jgi:prepilin-type processing-associated H-X9-DG protein